jgi:serine/threonine protein kinase
LDVAVLTWKMRAAISPETADAEWLRRLECKTKGRGPEQTRTKAEVEEIFALLRWMLKIDPARRMSAEEVLNHPWFDRGEDGQQNCQPELKN